MDEPAVPESDHTIALEPVDAMSVTILMDNTIDVLLPDHGPAKRPPIFAPLAVDSGVTEGGRLPSPLRAEHGFSLLVRLTTGDRTRTILFDAGVSPDGVVENMRRLDLDPRDIEIIVLSHGHFDHTTGMDGLARAIGRANLPVILHPEFWSRRRIAIPGRDPLELPSTSRAALEGVGFEVVEERDPSFLLDRAALVTGEVDRTTSFETGFAVHEAQRNGGWEPDPMILDDQALIVNVRDRGLVVLTGCGHSGVVNIVRYALTLTESERLHAVIGGFHLTGSLFEPIIGRTVDELVLYRPDVLVPGHCTGWKARHALAERFGDAFVMPSVGTEIVLSST